MIRNFSIGILGPILHVLHHIFTMYMIFTARKRSLGQGNIFTGVCQSFCLGWGVSVPGPMFLLRGLLPGGFSVRGEALSRVVSVQGVSV